MKKKFSLWYGIFIISLLMCFCQSEAQLPLYGMTPLGGNDGIGSIFHIDPANNNAFTQDYSLLTTGYAGVNPVAELTGGGDGLLYGVTSRGGTGDFGVLFSWDPVTNTYTRKYQFESSLNGKYPLSSLTLLNGKLYGIAEGGANQDGIIYSFDLDVNNPVPYTKLFEFSGYSSGQSPVGTLAVIGTKLYGMTTNGGYQDRGVIFEFDTDPNNPNPFRMVHYFTGTDGGGAQTGNSLTYDPDNGKLYGTTYNGGIDNVGVIFECDPDPNNPDPYTKMVDFHDDNNNINDNGIFPNSQLLYRNGKLYGTTFQGGGSGDGAGVLFQFDPNPTTPNYTRLFIFHSNDGVGTPSGNLKANGSLLYGVEASGQAIYQYDLANPTSPISIIRFLYQQNEGRPISGLTFNSDSTGFYGLAGGGRAQSGVLFNLDLSSAAYTNKFDFNLGLNGSMPKGSLAQIGGKLYGSTSQGGSDPYSPWGTLFEWDTATATFTTLKEFNYGNGVSPKGVMTLYNNKLYGVMDVGSFGATSGGAFGAIFEWDPVANIFTEKADFDGSNGSIPNGSLTVYNGKFYGMCYNGGANNQGTIFEWDPVTNMITDKQDFGGANDATVPGGGLTLYNNKFYGLSSGGTVNGGTLFEWDPVSNIYTKRIDFPDAIGAYNPVASLTVCNDKLYGITIGSGSGTLFEWDPLTGALNKKVDFDSNNGIPGAGWPDGGRNSLTASGGKLYGMTGGGGLNGFGVVFEYDPGNDVFTKIIDFDGPNGNRPYSDLVAIQVPNAAPPQCPAYNATIETDPTSLSSVCTGGTTNIVVNITPGAVAPYTIVYNDGIADQSVTGSSNSDTISVSPVATHSYTLVSVTDANGCLASVSGTATITVLPVVTPTVTITANTGNTICAGTLVTFTAMPVNCGSSPIYQWIKGNIITGVTTSTYSVSNLANGMGIKCNIIANNQCQTTPNAISNIITMAVRAPAISAINGPTNFCAYITSPATYNAVYTGTPTSFVWTLPSGVTAIGPSNEASIQLQFDNSLTAASISVVAASTCGNSNTKTLPLTKTAPAKPSVITAQTGFTTNVCSVVGTANAVRYTVTNVAGAVYDWAMPANAVIDSGFDGHVIKIRFLTGYSFTTGDSLKVRVKADCGNSPYRTLAIKTILPAKPSAITPELGFETNVCSVVGLVGASVRYSVIDVPGVTYEWQLPSYTSIDSGLDGHVIRIRFAVNYADHADSLKVRAVASCGISPWSKLVLRSSFPNKATAIIPPAGYTNNYCSVVGRDTLLTFSVAPVPGALYYSWDDDQFRGGLFSPPLIVTDNGTNTVQLKFPQETGGPDWFRYGGALRVAVFGQCGTKGDIALTLNATPPAKPASITASTAVIDCSIVGTGTTVTYTAAAVTWGWPARLKYHWTIPANTVIVSGQDTRVLQLGFLTGYHFVPGDSLGVQAMSDCGGSAIKRFAIKNTIPAVPGTIHAGPMSGLCGFKHCTYSIAAFPANATSVEWTAPVGGSISSGQGTIAVTIAYSTGGSTDSVGVEAFNNCARSGVHRHKVNVADCDPPHLLATTNMATTDEKVTHIPITTLYPNPTNGNFTISIVTENKTDKAVIQIINMKGQVIANYQCANNNGNIVLKINDSHLANGFYIVRYTIGKETSSLKFIIQR